MRKSRYYVNGPNLKDAGFEPVLLSVLEANRKRLGNRALHTILQSDARTFRQLRKLGYEGLMQVPWCGEKTANRIVNMLIPDVVSKAA